MVGLTRNTALVVIPPAESWPPIQAIREKYDRKIRRWMPHITLVYPFLPREQSDTARRLLADACGETSAFEIQLTEFSTFRHRRDNYTVWLRPEPEEPLVKLQAARCQSMQEAGKTAEFRFYEELNDLLPMERRKQSFLYGFWGEPAVKDAIEAIGVPHTEVNLILVNGVSVALANAAKRSRAE